MPWNVFLLPLLGGFLFLDWCYYTRLRHQRLEGNRLLIESAFVAAIITFVATVIVCALLHPADITSALRHWRAILVGTILVGAFIGGIYYKKFPLCDHSHRFERRFKTLISGVCIPVGVWLVFWICRFPETLSSISRTWKELLPFDYSGTAVLAMALGIGAAGLINYLSDYDGTAANVAEQCGDYFLGLCFRAVQNEKPITLFLSNGRTYTGYVALSPNLKPESQVALIVAANGHLQKDSSQPKWDAVYLPQWETDPVKATEFIVTIPTRLIDHAHIAIKELDHGGFVTTATTITAA